MAGPYSSEREPDAVAAAAHGQDGIDHEDVQTEEGSVPRDLADWAPDPEQNYSRAELNRILRKTIKGLPPGFRVVFELRDIQGLSTEDTAEALGLSVCAMLPSALQRLLCL